jgi:hypothetical protein
MSFIKKDKSLLTSSEEKPENIERSLIASINTVTEESKLIVDTGIKKVIKKTREIVKKVIPNKNWKMFKYAVYSSLIFFLLSAPQIYLGMNKLFLGLIKFCEPNGAPTLTGLVLQTILFCGVIYFMMTLHR